MEILTSTIADDLADAYPAFEIAFGFGPYGAYAALKREEDWGDVAFCLACAGNGYQFGHYVIVQDGAIIDLANPLGEELTKAEVLARLRSPDYELESLQHQNIRARVFGECAVVLARTVVKGRYRGEEAGGEFPYLRVWLRREGRWQAVAAQSTSLPGQ